METEMKFERTQSAQEIAARLLKLADELESGTITVVEDQVAVPEHVYLKIELEEEHTDDGVMFELEIEMSYPVALGDSESEEESAEEGE